MRLIGSLADQPQAEKFLAFLLTEGVHSHLEEEEGEFEIWIKDEDQIQRSVDAFKEFQSRPDDPKYSAAIPQAKELQLEAIKKRQRIAKNVVNVGAGQVKRNFPLTVSIIVICAVVALMTNFGSQDSRTKAPFRALAYTAMDLETGQEIWDNNNANPDAFSFRVASLSKGELWRAITPIFIHFDIFHLIFNMYWLVIFGSQIENRYGSVRFSLLVLGSALVSNFFQAIVPIDIGGSPPGFLGGYLVTQFGGMSGVNYALFGFVLMRMVYDRSSNLFVSQFTVMFLLGWLVFCMTPVATGMGINVANWAHAIGFLFGVIAGYWPMIFGSATSR